MESILGKMRGFSLCLLVLLSIVYIGAALDPPGDVVVAPDSDTSVTVTWTEPTDCSQCTYKIFYKVSGTADTQKEEPDAVSPHQLTSLDAGTTYEVQVVAVNDSVASNSSTAATGSTKPAVPTGVAASAKSDTIITVTWDAQDVDSFIVEHRLKSQGIYTASSDIDGSETSYDITGLQRAGFLYEVGIKAKKNGLESNLSTVVEQSTKPSAPTSVTATVVADTTDSITVFWDKQAGATFKVEYSVTGGDSFHVAKDDIAVDETSFAITGLTAGTQYDIRVTAKQNGLDSEATTTSAAASTHPEAPTNVQASAQSTTSIKVTWDSPSDADTFKVKYSVTEQTSYEIATNITGSSREYEITGLGAGLKYDIIVSATKYSLESAFSAVRTQATKPATPTGVAATAVDANTIEVTWTSGAADSFRVVYLETGADASSEQTATDNDGSPTTVSGLKAQTEYTVKVIAVTYGVDSDDSNTATVTTKAEASGITVTGVTTTSISISMTENTGTGVEYKIYFTDTTAGDGEQEATSTTHTYTISNLKPGHIYDIAVIVSVNGAPGDRSETKQDSTMPKQPSITQLIAASTTELSVTWEPAADSTQTSYKVQYKKNPSGGLQTVSGCSGLTCVIDVSSAGDPGQQYEVSVSAVQLTRESEPAKRNANTKPNPPGALSVDSRAVDQLVIKSTKPPNTVFDDFEVEVVPHGSITKDDSGDVLTATILSLTAGTKYTVTFRTASGSIEKSDDVTGEFYTKPATPGAPTRKAATTDSLTVSWAASDSANLDSYKLTLKETSGGTVIGSLVTVEKGADLETTFNSLTAGREYTVTVVAVMGTVESDAAEASMTIKPSQAKDITAKSTTTSSLTVQWEAPSDSDYTEFVVSISGITGNEVTVGSSKPREATFSDLTAGTAYSVSVSTWSGDQASVSLSKSLYTLPEAPTGLAMTAITTTTIDVQWTAPASNFSGYIITLKRSGSSDVTAEPGKQETEHQFTDLEAGSTYTISLVATLDTAADQVVLQSAEDTVTINTKPKSPTDLEVTDTSETTVTFKWTAPDSKQYTYKYTLTVENEVSPEVTRDGITSTEVTKSSLIPGTTYTLDVMSVLKSVESVPASDTFTLIPDKPADNLKVTNVGKTSLEFSWNSPPNGVFDGFIVRWKVKGTDDTSQSPTITATSYEIDSLTFATTYVVEVVAVSNKVESGSRTKEQETLPESAGEIQIKSKTTSSIGITWSPPPGDFDHYLLRIQPVPDGFTPVEIEKASTPEHTFTGLIPGNAYTLYVDVVFAGQTVTVERQVTTKPSVIATLMATTVDTKSIRITWTVDSNSIQDSFKIRYKIDGTTGGGTTTDAASDDRQKLIDGLSAGSRYVFDVWAMSGTTEGEIKSVEQTVVPLPVRGLTATPSRTQATAVTVSWSPGTGSTQDKYKVRYKGEFKDTDWGSYAEVNVPTVQYEPSNLIPGDRYTYEVIAVSGDQESSTQTTTAVQYPLPPPEVTIDTAATTTSSLSVEWTSLGDESYIEKWRLEYAVTGQTNWKVATTTSDENTLKYKVNQLTPGQKYTMRVYGITVDDIESQTATEVKGTVKPVITAELTEGTGTSTDKVVVEYGAETGGGVFNKYVFTINNVGTSQLEKAHDAAERKVTFDENIEAGHTYTVTAYTVSGTVQSDSKTLTVTTNPNPPTLECGTPTEKSITIIVTKPASGGVEKYKSTCSSCAQSNTQEKTKDANGAASFTYNNLESFKEYIVEVQAVFGEKDSMSVQEPCITGEAAPEAVDTFEYVEATLLPDEVTLKWTKPLVTNGIILRYELTYEAKGVEDTGRKDVPYPGTEHTFTGLKAGNEYTFTIKAWTKHKDPGDPKTVDVLMPLGKPFCQEDCATVQATVAETDIESSSVRVKFRNPFSDKYGKVDRFTIIVSTTNKTKAPEKLMTWAAAKNQISGDRFYAAIWECDIFDESQKCWDKSARKKRAVGDEITVAIGEESCDKNKDHTYCNGPLDAETNYFFTLRGHTVGTGDDLYQDTAVSSPVKTKAKESSSSNLIPIVVAVVVVLLILVVVAVVVLLWRRGIICSKSQTRGPDNHGMRPVSRRPKSYVGETSRPIKVADFSKHARKMAQDCDFLFAEEYETLKPVGMNQAMNAAELPENRSKNRFTNIKPYDQHRAKLLPTDDEDGSDYINASWMPGYNSKREFIVTQGPLPATRDDFWRLVWEQNCRAIIMLTKCVEKGRDKCDHYWPVDSEPMFYGDLQVAILNETKTAEWVVTEFKVSKGETSRKLRHFHYTVWPDFGVPERPQTLIRFVRLVRQYLAPDGGPIVVHCSAGVGRSGAFISIDRVLQQLNDRGDIIDIFGIVFEMRTYRRYMVQTEQQYVCIHKCIQCVVDGKEDDENPYQGQVNEAFEVDEGIVS